jgi:hypothetical protein
MALFFNSTYINIGDDRNIRFWEVKWLQGAAPKDIAPGLHKKAWFKRRIVYHELNNDNWIKNLNDINTPALLDEFVMLFLVIFVVSLSDRKVEVVRRYGHSIVASSYHWQFPPPPRGYDFLPCNLYLEGAD